MSNQSEDQPQALDQKKFIMMKNWCDFEAQKDCAHYLWEIVDFRPLISNKACRSNEFTSVIHNHRWYLMLKRLPSPPSENVAYLSLMRLYKKEFHKDILLKCKLSILNDKHKILKSSGKNPPIRRMESKMVKKDSSVSPQTGIRLLKIPLVGGLPDENLLHQGKLIVHCEMQFCEEISYEELLNENINKDKELSILSADFGDLLKNKIFTDITLSVKGTKFQAHKNILCARSSVFAAMFNHPMTENLTNTIEITDIDSKVVDEMLSFIYTGKLENLDQVADQLLVAADKYDLKGLKSMCEKTVYKNLTYEKLVDVLLFAELHHSPWLKSKVIALIVADYAEVMKTTSWKNAALANPHLMVEVCDAIGSPLGV